MKMRSIMLGGAFAVLSPVVSSAATISWGPATTISGDSDVYRAGTLVAADNFGPTGVTAATVNGVTFAPFAIPSTSQAQVSQGNVTLRETQSFLVPNNFGYGGSTSAPFSTLSAGYQNLLGNYASSGVIEDLVLTVSGLTVGQTYQYETWSNLSNIASNNGTDIAGGPELVDDVNGDVGGVGQYAIGTFTADATSQSVTFSGDPSGSIGGTSAFPLLSGFELAAVPEPASISLIGLGLLPLLKRRPRHCPNAAVR